MQTTEQHTEHLNSYGDLVVGSRVYSAPHRQEVTLTDIRKVTRPRSVGIWAYMMRDDGVEVFHAIGLVRAI